jgi:hypothetical protein
MEKAKLTDIATFIRDVTRPVCLLVMVACIVAMVAQGREVPTWFWGTFVPMFIWWSVDRSVKYWKQKTS